MQCKTKNVDTWKNKILILGSSCEKAVANQNCFRPAYPKGKCLAQRETVWPF